MKVGKGEQGQGERKKAIYKAKCYLMVREIREKEAELLEEAGEVRRTSG